MENDNNEHVYGEVHLDQIPLDENIISSHYVFEMKIRTVLTNCESIVCWIHRLVKMTKKSIFVQMQLLLNSRLYTSSLSCILVCNQKNFCID